MRERVWISQGPEATEALAEAIGRAAMPGLVVALDGDLGAGKTCFVRGLARGLDVVDAVSSPTYALMSTYSGRLDLYHFDAWMEGRERAFLADGGAEWLDSAGVAAVEWAARVARSLPEERLDVEIAHAGPTERRVTIRAHGRGERADQIARIVAGIPAIPALDEVA